MRQRSLGTWIDRDRTRGGGIGITDLQRGRGIQINVVIHDRETTEV